MVDCSRWERLMRVRDDLEVRERLVECIVYGAQELVSRGRVVDLEEAEELLKYGDEVSSRYSIPELRFHVELLRRRIEEKKSRGKSVS